MRATVKLLMNVLWLSHLIPYPPKGGVLQRAHYMVRELAKYHQVDLIAFNQEALLEPMFDDIEEGISEAQTELGKLCDRIEIIPIESTDGLFGRYGLALRSLFTRQTYTVNWLESRRYAETVVRFLESKKYDLVHFDTISLLPYKKLIGSIPTVLDHHNVESHMLLRRARNEKNPVRKFYFAQEGRRLEDEEKRHCPEFSMNITCSEVDKQRLARIAIGSSIEVIPNCVDTEYFQSEQTADLQKNSIIFVGTLDWYPNIEAVRYIAYEIWPKLKTDIPGIRADIIGANPPADIRAFADSDTQFFVHGFVNDIRKSIDEAGVYVCPIQDGGGTKLKILDALAMQKAIVAHPVACEGINVTDGKNVILAQAPEDYVSSIKQLLLNSEMRRELGLGARRLAVQEYGHETMGRSLSTLVDSVAESGKCKLAG